MIVRSLPSLPTSVLLVAGLAACQPTEPAQETNPPADALVEATVDAPNGTYVVELSAVETGTEDFAFLAPPEIPSGWITFRMKNQGEQPHFMLLRRLPDGITFGDYTEEVTRPFGALYARYQAGEMGRAEMLQELGGALPAWFASSPAMGGVGLTAPGRTAQATVLLEPGDYVMECYVVSPEGQFHSSLGMLRPLIVTSDPSGASPPEADVEITLSNYELVVEGELTRGEQTVRVDVEDQAEGLVGHSVHLARLDEGTRIEEVVKWMDWVDALRSPAPVEFLGGAEGGTVGADDLPHRQPGAGTLRLDL